MLPFFLKMALKNGLRHKLRACLTILGIVIAILAFGLLRTVVGAWYAGADAASDSRLVTRSSVSLVFSLPLSYETKIRSVDGVSSVSYATWFGGIYIDPRNFFPQFAAKNNYFDLYPEFLFDQAQLKSWNLDRRGAVVGRKLANRYGWKVGDVIPLKGTIFPGDWSFVIRAIYDGQRQNTDTNAFFFHWDYLNESLKQTAPSRANKIGVFVIGIKDSRHAAEVAQTIDAEFRNSLAETLTETEKAFQLGFAAMLQTIVDAIELVSYVVILIIMAVMANTMAMAARERTAEYATLKALGFGPGIVASLILVESLLLAALGGGLGILLTIPAVRGFGSLMDSIFRTFNLSARTVYFQLGATVLIGLMAAIIPAWRASRIRIVDGLRKLV